MVERILADDKQTFMLLIFPEYKHMAGQQYFNYIAADLTNGPWKICSLLISVEFIGR